MYSRTSFAKWIIPLGALATLLPDISGGVALFLGVLLTLTLGNPYFDQTRKLTHRFLTLSVIGLGAGMNLNVVARVGVQGLGYTVVGIAFSLLVGLLIGRILRVSKDTSLLISVGTAICGGSAIAALAPTIRAKDTDVSVALGIVFMLNAVALFIFPTLGHALNLGQSQFGLWSALAIHDTSSVVGATMQYGKEAMEIGTTVKLARALWIVPVTLGIGWWRTHSSAQTTAAKARKPWFILGFLLMAAFVTWVPQLQTSGQIIASIARRTLVLTLFLIGTNLSRQNVASVGFKPFIQGFILWLIVATTTLASIQRGWIHGF